MFFIKKNERLEWGQQCLISGLVKTSYCHNNVNILNTAELNTTETQKRLRRLNKIYVSFATIRKKRFAE